MLKTENVTSVSDQKKNVLMHCAKDQHCCYSILPKTENVVCASCQKQRMLLMNHAEDYECT